MNKADLLQMIADAEKEQKARKTVKPVPEGGADPVLVVVPRLPQLLEQTCDFIRRYVVFELDAQPDAISLWVAHTHLLEAFDFTPYISITAPSKKSGKSTTLDCLELLTPRPWLVIQPSWAVLFRNIDANQPTLLLDEADPLFLGNNDNAESVRAVLNAGFYRYAMVPRCAGDDHKVRNFKVFCPKAIASIGELPDTVRDRSVLIRMLRNPRARNLVEKFRKREALSLAKPILAGFKTLSADGKLIESLKDARPAIPDELGDRQADICEPLLAIADIAGDTWPGRARRALIVLCSAEQEDEETGMKLLHDIKAIFEDKDAQRIATRELLQGLVNVETDGPWPHWWEKDLKDDRIKGPAAKLALLLKPFRIKPRTFRQEDGSTAKGYMVEDFRVLFERYLT